MSHGARWKQLKREGKLCDCEGYMNYKEHNIYFCVNCNKPVPEPDETRRGKVRTINQAHSDATGIPMEYYNKHWEGNMEKVMKQHLDENDNVYTVGIMP